MRFAIAASALFAGLAAAVPAVTLTAYSTDIDTITSCAADVTNCPARSHSATAVASTSTEATSVAAVPTSSSVAGAVGTTAAPFPSAGNATAPSQSTIYLYSTDTLTITSCAPTVTNCPARTSLTSSIVGTSVVPVAAAPSSSEAGAVGVSSVAPYPIASNGTAPAWAPSGTGAASASGSASTSAYTTTYSGAGNHLNAGMALAGVGAFAALLL